MAVESIWIGNDRREVDAGRVARKSLLRKLSRAIPVHDLVLSVLQDTGLYKRPTTRGLAGRLIDELSARSSYDGSISTEHAIARFLVPHLAKTGWALFTDSDVLWRADAAELFDGLDPKFALYCVKHRYEPTSITKMDAQLQTQYPRKNWSSVMVFNCDHPANKALTPSIVNSLPGRDLHRFCWLNESEIGALSQSWNWLVGQNYPMEPKLVHFTEGTPDMPGYENCAYADEWRAYLD